MADIINLILVVIVCLLGGLPSVYIIASMFYMLGLKFRNKIKYGKSLFD